VIPMTQLTTHDVVRMIPPCLPRRKDASGSPFCCSVISSTHYPENVGAGAAVREPGIVVGMAPVVGVLCE
jgi:hypothetical protein